MKRLAALSPSQLATLALLGGVLQGSVFLIVIPAFRHDVFLAASLAIALFAGGVYLMLTARTRLKDGIQNEQWPATQLDPLRSLLESRATNLLTLALLLAFIALILLLPGNRAHSIGWSLFMPGQALNQLRIAIRPRPKSSPGSHWKPGANWQSFSPIHSDHWGER